MHYSFIIFILWTYSSLLYANPSCPNYVPPATTGTVVGYRFLNNTACTIKNNKLDACQAIKTSCQTTNYRKLATSVDASNQCYFDNYWEPYGWVGSVVNGSCPNGYTYTSGVCNLTDSSAVECPPVVCTANKALGPGWNTSGGCNNGCLVDSAEVGAQFESGSLPPGMTADPTQFWSEWHETGVKCPDNTPNSGTMPLNPANNCITNAHGNTLCLSDRANIKPGCGKLNGDEFCSDKVFSNPNLGECTIIGGMGYICGINKTAPNPAPGTPPGNAPRSEFKISVPVQGSNGLPTTGVPPSANGGVSGGTMPGTVGTYPGSDGTGNNGGNGSSGQKVTFDKSGLATEHDQHSMIGLLDNIKTSLTGTFTGTVFLPGSANSRALTDINPEIESKRLELSTRLSTIKAEYQQLISFGSTGASGGNLQCPPDAGFNFLGSNISLCTQSILNNTATIGNILIFLAAVVALYILLS